MNSATKKSRWRNLVFSFRQSQTVKQNNKGQAVVEFTLIFVLFLAVAWIPADFGLAFLTGQLAQNASREAARIAAADPCLKGTAVGPPCLIPGIADQRGSCTLGGSCSSEPPDSVLAQTAARLSSALLPGATITVTYPVAAGACNDQVNVTVDGDYNYFFLQLLRLLGVSVPTNSQDIIRSTDMRWEHQLC